MNDSTPLPTTEIVEIHDLDSFVRALVHWHTSKVGMLRHIQQLPEGTEVRVGEGGSPVILQGDVLAAFQAGVETALIELGELPFSFELEEEAEPGTGDTPSTPSLN